MKKRYIIFALMVFFAIWFWPNIYGQYRFELYCKREAGTKMYGTLAPDLGWLVQADGEDSYKMPFRFGRVAFVRYQDKLGKFVEVRAETIPGAIRPAYVSHPIDGLDKISYLMNVQYMEIPGELRLKKSIYSVSSFADNRQKIVVVNFYYDQFDQDRSLLGAPSTVKCESGNEFFKLANAVSIAWEKI